MLDADDGASWPAGIVFAAAGITDQVDGWLARRWSVESRFGKLADPLADRLMIDAAVIMLWLGDRLPWPALAIILLRDALLVGGYKLVVPRGYDFEVTRPRASSPPGSCTPRSRCLIVTSPSADWPLWLFWLGVALAVVAAAQYVLKARREVRT